MNIILRELKANLKSLILWCIGGIILVYIGVMKYEAFADSNSNMGDVSESIPESIRIIFGFDKLNLTEIGGYYGIMFLYFVLMGTIHAVMLGAIIISKEERDQTADFLFVKPLTRKNIITSKLIAGTINIIVFNLTILFSSIIFVAKHNNGESLNGEIVNLMFALFILQLIFYSIGTGVSALTHSSRKATGISAAVLLGTYILSIAIDLYDKIDFLKYITPFKYFESKNIMFEGNIDFVYLVISLLVIVAATLVTYKGYERHDLHV
ncbi:MAG: ABC transporter permease subunit [Vulcanibacillus sp.]